MRPASFFIILYLLFLLTQPCQDVFASVKPDTKSLAEITAVHTPMPTEEENTDACSPFCICSCCSISVGYYARVEIIQPGSTFPIVHKLTPEYKNPLISTYQNSIWQPPKN